MVGKWLDKNSMDQLHVCPLGFSEHGCVDCRRRPGWARGCPPLGRPGISCPGIVSLLAWLLTSWPGLTEPALDAVSKPKSVCVYTAATLVLTFSHRVWSELGNSLTSHGRVAWPKWPPSQELAELLSHGLASSLPLRLLPQCWALIRVPTEDTSSHFPERLVLTDVLFPSSET